jgi:hypothetical protein
MISVISTQQHCLHRLIATAAVASPSRAFLQSLQVPPVSSSFRLLSTAASIQSRRKRPPIRSTLPGTSTSTRTATSRIMLLKICIKQPSHKARIPTLIHPLALPSLPNSCNSNEEPAVATNAAIVRMDGMPYQERHPETPN